MVSSSVLLGMLCSVFSTILTNIGSRHTIFRATLLFPRSSTDPPSDLLFAVLMQKHSADVEKGLPLYRRWRFWLGFLVNMGSEVVHNRCSR